MSDPRDDDHFQIPPDEKRHYSAHVERAVANAERAVGFATGDGAGRNEPHVALGVVLAQAMSAQTDALLAIADRLDVLIGCLFDEGRPITVRQEGEA